MKNKMFIFAFMIFMVGITMILGTSYSLVTNRLISNETYGFKVANFDVSFNDDTKIAVSSIPMTDEEGMKKSLEYTFHVDNNSDYDINYRLDIIENSAYNMGSVIHYAYSINDSEYSDIRLLKDYPTVKQNKVLKKNTTDMYKIKIWLSIDADESFMNKSFAASIMLSATQNEYKYASTVIEKLANSNKDNIIKTIDGFRYSKNDSANYVWFNCQDGFTKGEDYCEKWRIIGSFINKSEKSTDEFYSLKLISTLPFENIAYNSEENNNYNEAYISSYANGFFYDKLNNNTKKMILKARWNIGEVNNLDYEQAILEEKKNIYYANIGLPNVSDYLFLQKEWFNDNNMMFLNRTNNQINVLDNGIKVGNNSDSYAFVPCIYLRGDVSIISGDGNVDNPYELMIKYPLNY